MDAPSVSTLLAVIDRLQDAVFVMENEKFVFVNKRLVDMLDRSEKELLSRPVFDFIYAEDVDTLKTRYAARRQGQDVVNEYQFRIVTGGGDVRDVNMRVAGTTDENGVYTTIGSVHDITESKHTQKALEHSQADIESILNNLPDVFYRADMKGIITEMSPSCFDAIGYTRDEMIGQPMADFYCNPSDRETVLGALSSGGGRARQIEACMRHKDGTPIWVSTNAYIRYDKDHEPMCIEGIGRNITERKRYEDQLQHMATHDTLTGLPTRGLCMDHVAKALASARRHKTKAAILFIDLNGFKAVNDTLGHDIGDHLLISVARRLVHSVREMDTVSRMGGDEFIVVLDGIEEAEHACRVAEKLLDVVAHPHMIGAEEVVTGASIGIALYPDDGEDAEHLVQKADAAMYVAKKRNQDGYFLVSG